MWFIVLSLVVFGFLFIAICRYSDSENIGQGLVLLTLIYGFATAFLVVPVLACTTGLWPDYGEGQREGYMTKISYKGVIWKTWEAQIQVGTGDMAALQEPFSFSTDSQELADKIKNSLGKKVSIHYKQWYIQPYRHGDTSYQLDTVELLEEEN